MGAAFVNSRLRHVACWGGAIVVLGVNVVLVWDASGGISHSLWVFGILAIAIAAYVFFVAYLIIGPHR